MESNINYLLWHNTQDGPLFCGLVRLESIRDELYLSCYGERLVRYFDHNLKGYFELAESYGFPVFNFDKAILHLPDGPHREDEPFVFLIKPLLRESGVKY